MQVRHIPSIRKQRKKRVAAYCRVSTGRYDQEESYEIQQSYYNDYIRSKEQWDFAGIYADEKSGMEASNRPGFQSLMKDALAGKVDMILVKSISRFSRNVVDCEQSIKILASHGVSIYFEKEGILSTDYSSSLLLSLMAAIAQNESRSISENVKWANQERVRRGEYNLGNNRVLGYDSVDGKLVPNADAGKVRHIFELFLGGMNFKEIADRLREEGIMGRRNIPITLRGVAYILRNEIYVGDRLLQKQAPKNFLTKQPEKNVAYDSCYLTDDHEAIISRDDWEKAQKLLARKSCVAMPGAKNKANTHTPLYGKIFCAECEAPYTRITVFKSIDDAGKRINHKSWECTERVKSKKGNGCRNKIIPEEDLLKEISEQMGWEWTDAEHFPYDRLDEIEYAEVGKEGIAVYEK